LIFYPSGISKYFYYFHKPFLLLSIHDSNLFSYKIQVINISGTDDFSTDGLVSQLVFYILDKNLAAHGNTLCPFRITGVAALTQFSGQPTVVGLP
jgi:hypothetical protein